MTVWIFWLVAGLLCAVVAAVLTRGLWHGASDVDAPDVTIYRQQLREVERDMERGTIVQSEAERLRAEISRRLLEADRVTSLVTQRGPVIGAALVVLMLAAAVLAYLRLGAPGYPDLPLAHRIAQTEELRAGRPSQAEALRPPRDLKADPDYVTLVEQLREAVAANPEDLRGWRLLARNEGALGNFAAAATAQARVVELGDGNPADRTALAEAMIIAAGGYVSPEAEAVLDDTLQRDPNQPLALYYYGLMMVQGGRDDIAFTVWRRTLDAAPDAPFAANIRAAMPEIAARAGERWEDDTPPPGPTPQQVEAMSQMDPAARQAAIGNMVQGLADRLATVGGSAEEWARLISAYGVLGQTDRAAAIWDEAQDVFTEETGLATVRAAALKAGVAE